MSKKDNLPQEYKPFQIAVQDETKLKEIMISNLEGLSPEFSVVKIPTGGGLTFEVPTDSEPDMAKELIGIILDHYPARAYWPGSFEGANQPPECSSLDGKKGTKYGDCASCQFSQWGTGKNERGQACKLTHRIFLLTEDSIFPLMISAPPTSVRNVGVYATKLAGRVRFMDEVITKIKLTKTQNKDGIAYSKLEFFNNGDLDEQTKAKVRNIGKALKEAMRKRAIETEEYTNVEEETTFP